MQITTISASVKNQGNCFVPCRSTERTEFRMKSRLKKARKLGKMRSNVFLSNLDYDDFKLLMFSVLIFLTSVLFGKLNRDILSSRKDQTGKVSI